MKKINTERLETNIIEAAEQCERLDLPTLHPLTPLHDATGTTAMPLYACLERKEARSITKVIKPGNAAFLIGPEGGFDESEIAFLNAQTNITPVSLGTEILRSETAALTCLTLAKFNRD